MAKRFAVCHARAWLRCQGGATVPKVSFESPCGQGTDRSRTLTQHPGRVSTHTQALRWITPRIKRLEGLLAWKSTDMIYSVLKGIQGQRAWIAESPGIKRGEEKGQREG